MILRVGCRSGILGGQLDEIRERNQFDDFEGPALDFGVDQADAGEIFSEHLHIAVDR